MPEPSRIPPAIAPPPTVSRLLLPLACAAVAVLLVPWLLWGTRLDRLVADWLDPLPAPSLLAVAEVAVLAADILLPVPSSLVVTLGGAGLGVVAGSACAWVGMTAGSMLGWWLGRLAGARRRARLAPAERAALARQEQRLGPLIVILTRPLPLLAEAVALLAGAAGMSARAFLGAAAAANLVIACVWSVAGALGREADALGWVAAAALAGPALVAWLVGRRGMQSPAGPV